MIVDILRTSKCECGSELNYKATPFLQNEKRICPNCGRIHYVDSSPIDFSVFDERKQSEVNNV